MTFGERLYELRNKNNLSQEELAEVLDVSRQSISKWENDKGYPEMTRLLFMSDYFDVSLDYLMRGIKKENNEEKANNNTEVLNGTVSSKEDKAIELVKKKWGSTEGVYFSNMAINSRGNYIVTVNDSITSKTLAFYEVDVENEMVKER